MLTSVAIKEPVKIVWHGPFSFFDVVQSVPDVAEKHGVYMWTIPIGSECRVNYIGKVFNRPFSSRSHEEWQFACCGKTENGRFRSDPIVDADRFIIDGERVVKSQPRSLEELIAARPEVERVYRAYWVFLGLVTADDASDDRLKRVEATITRHLWSTCKMCQQLMPARGKLKRPGKFKSPPVGVPRLRIESDFITPSSICGLTKFINEMDWGEYI
jgi:hypothetical protein